MSLSFNQTTPLRSWVNTSLSSMLDENDDENDIDKRSLAEIIIWSTFLIMIIMASLIGNMFVIACVVLNHRLRNEQANMFIVSLSLTDICSALIVMCSSLYGLIADEWYLGQVWCDIICGANYTLIIVSMLTLCFISLDRYFAVLHALHYHSLITRKRIYFAIGYAWFQGLCFGLAPIMARWIRYDYWEIVCAIVWHEENNLTLIYVIIAFAVCFLLPGTILVVAYCKIMKVATSHNDIHPHNLEFRPNVSVQSDLQTTGRSTQPSSSVNDMNVNDRSSNQQLSRDINPSCRVNNITQAEESYDTTEMEDATGIHRQEATVTQQSMNEIKAGYPQINIMNGSSKNKDIQNRSHTVGEASRRLDIRRHVQVTNYKKWAENVENRHRCNSMELKMLNDDSYDNEGSTSSVRADRPCGAQNKRCRHSSSDCCVDSEHQAIPHSNVLIDFESLAESDSEIETTTDSNSNCNGIQYTGQNGCNNNLNSTTTAARTLIEALTDSEDLDKQLQNTRPGNFLNLTSTPGGSGRSGELNKHTKSEANGSRQQLNKNNNRKNYSSSSKAVRSLLIVVLAYFICMTPFSITKLYKVVVPVKDAIPGYVNLVATLFQYCSSAINPLIYGVFRKDFQKAFILLLKRAFARIRNRDLNSFDNNVSW